MPTRSLERAYPWLDWFTHERRNWIGALIICSLGGYGLGNGHTTSGAVEHISNQLGDTKAQVHKLQTETIPKLKAANHCEGARADKATDVAKQAIVGALVPAAPIPDPATIPADNCSHPIAK